MGMGIPVLHGVAGESSEIVKRERVGLVFEPENAKALCDALMALANSETMRDEFRVNCVAAARRYDRGALARRMLEILDAALASQAATTGAAVRLTNRQN
jgi:glycosyltransferase involved in cell wall biosynthesis